MIKTFSFRTLPVAFTSLSCCLPNYRVCMMSRYYSYKDLLVLILLSLSIPTTSTVLAHRHIVKINDQTALEVIADGILRIFRCGNECNDASY